MEKTRYEEFYTKFKSFYESAEEMDSMLASYLSAQMTLIDKNATYEFFIAGIELNQNDLFQEDMYALLIEYGFSEEEARSLIMLLSIEGQTKIIELSELPHEELMKEKERLRDKENKTSMEKILLDLLEHPSFGEYIRDLASDLVKTNGFTSFVEKVILGSSLKQAKLDVDDLQKQINELTKEFMSMKKPSVKKQEISNLLEHYQNVKNLRVSKIKFTENTIKALQKVGQAISYISLAIESIDNYNNAIDSYEKYGVDEDKAKFDFIVDEIGLISSTAAGGYVGGAVGSLFGPAGTVVGTAVGGFIGMIIESMVDNIINSIGDFVYDNIIEPKDNFMKDLWNEIEDWWDILCW